MTAILINPYALAPVAPVATREYRAVKASANSTSATHTFSACDTGSADVGRRVFGSITFFSTSSRTITSVTIGGVAGVVHHQRVDDLGGGYYIYAAIVSAPLDAGTTGDVVITLNSSANLQLKACATYKVLGLQSATAIDTASGGGSGAVSFRSLQIDVEDGGLLFDCVMTRVSAGSPTYTYSAGVDRDVQSALNASHHIVAGSIEVTADEANRTVTVNSTVNFTSTRVMASFR